MLKNNPVMKRLVETGEERIGKIAQQLLSNEKFVATLQGLVSRTLAAKGMLDKNLRSALAAMPASAIAVRSVAGKIGARANSRSSRRSTGMASP